ncbi:MAG: polysaccharide deacetylase family protein [Patescibacteria group bacterium]|mgnify:CR=1 FL=1
MFFLKFLNFLLSRIDGLFFSLPVILTYHSVSDGKTPISVTVANFEKQMAFLKGSGLRVISIKDFFSLKEQRSKEKSILITFDDAFKDVFLNALPILKKYNFPAVVFINPLLLGKKADFATREEDRGREICSFSDLRQLEENGVAIANHGYSHKQLSGLSELEAVSEYKNTFDFIKENLSKNAYPNVFVFPKGAKNEEVKTLLKTKGAEILDRRVDIYSDTSLFGFVLKLSGFYFWLKKKVFLIK